jgi:hypothetical protein
MTRVLFALAALSLAAVQDEMIENPEYKSWSTQKAGAWVKFKMKTEIGERKMEGEVTTKLKEITDTKAVIEQTSTFEIMGQKQSNTLSRTLESKIKKGTDSEGSKSETVGEGDEEIEIKGKKMKCHWVQTKVSGKNGTALIKRWLADEIVGGAARMEITNDGGTMKMTSTLTAIDWKAGD